MLINDFHEAWYKQLCYKQLKNQTGLIDIDTGVMEFDAFARRDPKCYIGPVPAFEELPGKVVLCAALLQQQRPEFLIKLKKTLLYLHQKGLAIHYFDLQKHSMSAALTPQNIRALENVVTPVQLETYKEVFSTLAQQGVIADAVTVFDDITLPSLVCNEQINDAPTFPLVDLIYNHYQAKVQNETFCQALIESPAYVPGVRLVMGDDILSISQDSQKQVKNFLKNHFVSFMERYIPRPQALILNIPQEISNEIPLIELISSNKINWTDLTILNISHNNTLSGETLAPLLVRTPQLEYLNIESCTKITALNLHPGSLSLLKDLNLSNTKLCAEVFITLLKAASQLKKLNFSCHYHFPQLKGLAENSLPHLEELDISYTNISTENLITLLQAAPRLKKLNISHLLNITSLKDLPENSLAELEELDISYTAITEQDLITLLQAAPRLKKLNISHLFNITSLKDLPENSLAELEELDISYTAITEQDLITLLQAEPRLKKLNISQCLRITSLKDLSENSFAELEELNISYTKINEQDLITLLQAALRLKKLNISRCTNITSLKDLPENSLAELEELDISHTKINEQDLITLLQAALRLKKLNISRCTNITSLIDLPENSLAELEELDISYTKINEQDLITLLQAAPRLKKLNISRCTNITSLIDLPENSFAELEELDISYTAITEQDLITLLQAAPRLKKLNIFGCNNITSLKGLPKNSLAELEELDISNISITTLEFLLENSPVLRFLSVKNKKMYEQLIHDFPNIKSKITISFPNDTNPVPDVTPTVIANSAAPTVNGYSLTKNKPIDYNTVLHPTQFTPLRIFFAKNGEHPHPSLYRLEVYDQLQRDPTLQWITQEHFQPLTDLTDPKVPTACFFRDTLQEKWTISTQFYAKKSLHLQANQWTAVPSLSANESLPFYYANHPSLEWGYDAKRRLYGVRVKETCDITLEYLVDVPGSFSFEKPIHPVIKKEADHYEANFIPGVLENLPPVPSGKEVLDALQTQMRGVCRHGTVAFFHWLQQQYNDILILSTLNEPHAFVEIFEEGRYKKIPVNNNLSHRGLVQTNIQEQQITSPLTATSSPLAKQEVPSLFSAPWFTQPHTPLEKSILIDTPHTEVPRLSAFLYTHFQKNYAIHNIHHPDALRCLISSFILKNAQATTFTRQNMPSGATYDFLQSSAHQKIIFVDFNAFSAADLVTYNSVLDDSPTLDGIPIPSNIHIIGFYDKKAPRHSTDTAFDSRIEQEYTATSQMLNQHKAYHPLTRITAEKSNIKTPGCFEVDLFDSIQWESFLWGPRRLHRQTLEFVPAELFIALRDAPHTVKKLVLTNPPWHLEKFQQAWRDALISQTFHVGGLKLPFPPDLEITYATGYDWEHLNQNRTFINTATEPVDYLLNPSTLPSFFDIYEHIEATAEKKYTPGWLQRNKGKTLTLHLTRDLTDSELARLLTQAQQYKIALNILTKPQGPTASDASDYPPPAGTGMVFVSNDIDYTTAFLQAQENHPIDIVSTFSEEQERYLFHISQSMMSNRLNFTHAFSDLWNALCDGKTVLLKGKISPRVQDILAELLQKPGFLYHNGKPHFFKGRLLIVTNEDALKTATSSICTHISSAEERLTFVNALYPSQSAPCPEEKRPTSYVALEARALHHHTTRSLHKYGKDRLGALLQGFQEKRSLCVNGTPGTGKTHLVETLKHQPGYTVTHDVEAWAQNKADQHFKILVIDNVNADYLTQKQYDILQDACNPKNPSVFINGHYYALSPQHKILFLMDMLEKKIYPEHPLFAQPFTLGALSDDEICDNIIQPILETARLNAVFLYFYHNLKDHMQTSMTPRHIEMMVLLFATLRTQIAIHDDLLAQYCAYEIAQKLLSVQQKAAFKDSLFFENLFFDDESTLKEAFLNLKDTFFRLPQNTSEHREFTWLDTHQETFQMIAQSIAVRDFQQDNPLHTTQHTGTPLIILEGISGIGKSAIVRHILKHLGFSEYMQTRHVKKTNRTPHPDPRMYCYIPASAAETVKITLLTQAFMNGWVAVMDESNSAPLPTAFLRSLLDGHLPDGTTPHRPGFRMIVTQNAISLRGRHLLAPELMERSIRYTPKPYTQQNLLDILQHTLDLQPQNAQILLNRTLNQHYPGLQNITDLNPRKFLNCAKKIYLEQTKAAAVCKAVPHLIPSPLPPCAFFRHTAQEFCA